MDDRALQTDGPRVVVGADPDAAKDRALFGLRARPTGTVPVHRLVVPADGPHVVRARAPDVDEVDVVIVALRLPLEPVVVEAGAIETDGPHVARGGAPRRVEMVRRRRRRELPRGAVEADD